MSLLGRLTGRESRAALKAPPTWLAEALGSTPVYSGQSVSVDSSLRLVPVYSAVSLLSSAVGSIPLVVYRRLDEGRERAQNHRAWRLLHDLPNPEMAADEVWEMVTTHLLLWGNAYILKLKDGPGGSVSELWPLRPSRVQVDRNGRGERRFLVDGKDEAGEDQILHIRGLSYDGTVGLSPIAQARQMLGNSMALEEFTGRFYGNSANPGGVLSHKGKLSEDAAKRLKAQWRAMSGVAKAGETVILEEDMEWKQVGMPLEDAQFIETTQFSDLRVAQLFGIPPYMLGAKTGDSLTYANIESQGIDFVRRSVKRWAVRIEQALLRDQDIFLQGSRIYPEFLLDALHRADTKTRYESYRLALDPQKGWMSRDEVRVLENLSPTDDEPPAVPAEEPIPEMVTNGHP